MFWGKKCALLSTSFLMWAKLERHMPAHLMPSQQSTMRTASNMSSSKDEPRFHIDTSDICRYTRTHTYAPGAPTPGCLYWVGGIGRKASSIT